MNQFTKEQLLIQFPNAPEKEIKQAIKYQDKFSLTLDNLKCLNPDCNNIRKWNNGRVLFNLGCTNNICNETTKNLRNKIGAAKGSATYEQRTGYTHPGQNPEVQQKMKETCSKKYGVPNFNSKHIINFEQWNNKQFWIDNFLTNDNNFDYMKCMEYFKCKQVATHYQIKKLEINYTKIVGTSLKEQALYPFLDSLNFIYETNVRNVIDNLELDIYFPELDLAIEYNGLYWHSYHEAIGTSPKQLDLSYMKYRHWKKSLACINNGIRLLHIYEDAENIENLILDFINYESNIDKKEYELDSGCYPLGLEYDIIEPESRIVLGDRLLFNAGGIKIKEENI